ncbi:MAG: phosphoribosylamine--glycine ligase [Pseudomonadota bacterium]|nr:phosphoribosylamine--glycine ligase [Pseudomonadota bacterium]
MKVLVIGGGGREHALAWKLAASPRVETVYVAPGNAGTGAEPKVRNLGLNDLGKLADFALAEKIALTVVGPEAALAAGAVDIFRAKGLRIFGPTRAAARLESSKAFAKAFMQRHAIPTAGYAVFDDAASAHGHVDAAPLPIVVKADGLAAGKGVVVAATRDEAHAAIDAMLGAEKAARGNRVVIEEFLAGEEASFMVVCDGYSVLSLATSQDHKRIGDGDTGPNTGGMGAYSPAPVVTPNVHARVMHEIVVPTVEGMAADGVPFSGFLYVGLMIDAHGAPKTVEFNCRLGDPETQPILMRLKSDLFELLMHATAPDPVEPLADFPLQWDRRVALGVVMAASGYPGDPQHGDPIAGLPADSEDVKVFHGGTAAGEGMPVTAGGRVLCVTALGDSTRLAQQRAYEIVRGISFAGAQYRRDIGQRALKR